MSNERDGEHQGGSIVDTPEANSSAPRLHGDRIPRGPDEPTPSADETPQPSPDPAQREE